MIGRAERVRFLDWGARRLKAKVDTGAKTSSIHAEDIVRLPRRRVRFAMIMDKGERRHVEARVTRVARVKSSNGTYEDRIFIEARVQVGPVVKTIEVSLTPRPDMRYRMLLGQKALEGDFVVDVSQRYIADRSLNRDEEKPAR